jgi:ribonuclease E
MKKEMLINTVESQECRIAILADGELEELYIERASSASHVGNIYKGRVVNVEPSIQAAFVDFGGPKNGFLHISDLHPQYFGKKQQKETEAVGRKRPHRSRPPIQKCLQRGQEVIVQMTKEGIGTKGPTLTTYLSIPGRLLVMMPGMSKLGVSRKIEDDDARSRAKKILNELKTPDDMGFIVRTAGVDRAKRDLQRDLRYLLRLWKTVEDRGKKAKAPCELYRESDLVIRTIRDVYNTDVDRIICDSAEVGFRVKEFLEMAVPRSKHKIEQYTGKEGLFHEFGLEEEIEKIYSRRVELKCGGSLVIDQTEALVAIDVNSGRFRAHSDAETSATRLNEKAAEEVLRQLRLRDLGGVIVIDFVDMRSEKNRRSVEKIIREGLKEDRAKTKVLRMSAFGLLELTRQRVRPSLKDAIYHRCSYCNGMGLIKSDESQSLMVMRILQRAVSVDDVAQIQADVTPAAAHHLNNYQRDAIARLERESGKRIVVRSNPELSGHDVEITCTNGRGSKVSWDAGGRGKGRQQAPETTPIEQIKAPAERPSRQPLEEARDAEAEDIAEAASEARSSQNEKEQQQKPKKKRRRGKRGGRKHRKKKNQQQDQQQNDQQKQQKDQDQNKQKDQGKQSKGSDRQTSDEQKDQGDQDNNKKKRRRGRRGGRRRKKSSDQQQQQDQQQKDKSKQDSGDHKPQEQTGTQDQPKKQDHGKDESDKQGDEDQSGKQSRRRGRRGGKRKKDDRTSEQQQQQKAEEKDQPPEEKSKGETDDSESEKSGDKPAPKKRKKTARRRKKTTKKDETGESGEQARGEGETKTAKKAKRKKSTRKKSTRKKTSRKKAKKSSSGEESADAPGEN